ncbi:MAG: NUDIX domain-containing protein [Candidatus Portnoybacteria bacterium]|nr:NUDIX domain-containing protein [Candidatus Portnoybacteria bacterium]MDD4982666.1 NUDIX domain-containing protein [Candidatus Portnoybacteria bacterium]
MKRFFIWRKTTGAVIFYRSAGGKIEYLLLRHRRYWGFPKGGTEKEETELAAARREIKEETNLSDIVFISGFKIKKKLLYRGTQNSRKAEQRGRVVFTEMVFFLAQSRSKNAKISSEHLGFAWLDFETAKKRLTESGNNHKVLIEADKFLRAYPVKNKKQG